MIIQVREGRLQVRAHPKPGFRIDRLGDSIAELKVIGEHGFCILELTLLDGIHEGLYGFSFIHNVFLLLLIERILSKWAWELMDAPYGTPSVSPD
jgi:hypothetical protein